MPKKFTSEFEEHFWRLDRDAAYRKKLEEIERLNQEINGKPGLMDGVTEGAIAEVFREAGKKHGNTGGNTILRSENQYHGGSSRFRPAKNP